VAGEPADTDTILTRARNARAAGADLVIVAVHTGTEYDTEPKRPADCRADPLSGGRRPGLRAPRARRPTAAEDQQQVVLYGSGNTIAAQETPVEGTRQGLLVRVTFSQDRAGVWSTSDVAWVPSLQNPDPPPQWCSLTAGVTCVTPEVDPSALTATTDAVNLYGIDSAGAHPLDHP
jgi:poly-gamma-glutamate synthesis protein (capsule biosynthesis protein)